MKHICTDGKTVKMKSGELHKRCGAILVEGAPGEAHRCDGKPGSSHDVSTCSRCEVRP